MVDYIQPLELQKIMINIFAGTPEIFTGIAIVVIFAMAAFFRMSAITMFIMIGIFLLMFSGTIGGALVTLMAIIGGLLIGYLIAQIFQR